MQKLNYIGIDNGIGTIGLFREIWSDSGELIRSTVDIMPVPVRQEYDYTKKKQKISRLDFKKMVSWLKKFKPVETYIALERPIVNPARFRATLTGIRLFEAMILALEASGHSYVIVDSKQWQKKYLPAGIKGSAELKKASRQVGRRIFPAIAEKIKKDADGLFIAKWLRDEIGRTQ